MNKKNANISSGTSGRGLDRYLKQAASEKVGFTQDAARTMIENHIATGTSIGLLAKLSTTTSKIIISSILTVSVFVGITMLNNNDAESPKPQVNELAMVAEKNIENEVIQKKLKTEPEIKESEQPTANKTDQRDVIRNSSNSLKPVLQAKNEDKKITEKNVQDKPKENEIAPVEKSHVEPEIAMIEKADITIIDNNAPYLAEENNEPEEVTYEPVNIELGDDKQKTLIGNIYSNTGYLAYSMKFPVKNTSYMLIGGKCGWTINHSLTIGVAGYGLANFPITMLKKSNGMEKDMQLGLGYGGVFFEYINSSKDLVHFTVNTLIGAGGYTFSEPDSKFDIHGEPSAAFFVFEPGVSAEVNLFKSVRIGLEASYRFIGDDLRTEDFSTDKDYMRDFGLEGFSYGFTIKAGIF